MKQIVFCLCILVFYNPLFAQFNDSTTHLVSGTASGNINRANAGASYLLTNEVRFSTKKKRITTNSSVRWLFGEIGDRLTNNDFLSSHDINLFTPRGNLYYWGLANYTTSFSLRINHQLQSGLGIAYNFVNTSSAWFNLSNGLLYEASRVTINDSLRQNYQTVRNSFRLSYRFVIGDVFIINGSNFLQNSFQDSNDFIIRATNGAGVKLNRWLSFTTTLTYNQFRRTGRENLLLTYGLTAERYF